MKWYKRVDWDWPLIVILIGFFTAMMGTAFVLESNIIIKIFGVAEYIISLIAFYMAVKWILEDLR